MLHPLDETVVDATGMPHAGATVQAFYAGTNIGARLYADREAEVPVSGNAVTTNSLGRTVVLHPVDNVFVTPWVEGDLELVTSGPTITTEPGASGPARRFRKLANEIITPFHHGAPRDRVSDASAALQRAIEDALEVVAKGGRPVIDGMGYPLALNLPFAYNESFIWFRNFVLKRGPEFAADGSGSRALLKLGGGNQFNALERFVFITDLLADCIDVQTGGFANQYAGLLIEGFQNFAFRQGPTCPGGFRVFGSQITQSRNSDQRTGTGVILEGDDSKWHNNIIRWAGTCVDLIGKTHQFVDNHVYNGASGNLGTPVQNSVNVRFRAGSRGCTFSLNYVDKGVLWMQSHDHQVLDNRLLFKALDGETDPLHTYVVRLDAGDVVDRQFPTRLVMGGWYSTTPVSQGDIPFLLMDSSGTGNWSADALAFADACARQDVTGRVALRDSVEAIGGDHCLVRVTPNAQITLRGAGVGNPVSLSWWNRFYEVSGTGAGIRAVTDGTAASGVLRAEGSRAAANQAAGVLQLVNRAGADRDPVATDTAREVAQFSATRVSDGGGGFIPQAVLSFKPVGTDTVTDAFRWSPTAFEPIGTGGSAQALGSTSRPWAATYTRLAVLADGITAPAAVAGTAQLYVDAADGDLKVIFGDGAVKTLATDT